jgi:hypothetical protein
MGCTEDPRLFASSGGLQAFVGEDLGAPIEDSTPSNEVAQWDGVAMEVAQAKRRMTCVGCCMVPLDQGGGGQVAKAD